MSVLFCFLVFFVFIALSFGVLCESQTSESESKISIIADDNEPTTEDLTVQNTDQDPLTTQSVSASTSTQLTEETISAQNEETTSTPPAIQSTEETSAPSQNEETAKRPKAKATKTSRTTKGKKKVTRQELKIGADTDFQFILMGQDFVTMDKEYQQFKEKLNKWVQFIEVKKFPNPVAAEEVEEIMRLYYCLSAFLAACSAHTTADYHMWYDHLPALVWITNAEGTVIFLNKCYQDFVGIQDIYESKWTDFLHPDDMESMVRQRTIAIRDQTMFHTQYRLRNPMGEYKWFLSQASPLFGSSGEVVRWFGVNTNIHDKMEAIDREKRQNIFFASSVHELKTPLAGIIGLTEMLLQTKLDDEQRADLDAILQCGTNVISLTANLLDFCKLESKKLMLEIAPFSLAQLLRHLVKMTKLMKNQEITLTVSEELEEPHLIEGDYGRINQIFTNIVTNAAKFTPPDGIIQIDVRVGPAVHASRTSAFALAPIVVHCKVVDNGIGIDPESLPNLFRPFSQNRNSRNSDVKGHGLGLFITKNLIHLMEGHIEVQSDITGTTIAFTLPYRPYMERKRSNAVQQQKAQQENTRPPLTVMIVEDNHITRNIVKRLLEKYQIKVYAMSNGQSAIDAYCHLSGELDAILLDLYLPDMHGVKVLSEIRKLRSETSKIPVVIAFTASGESEQISTAFDGVIYKPFRQDDFITKLHQFVHNGNQSDREIA